MSPPHSPQEGRSEDPFRVVPFPGSTMLWGRRNLGIPQKGGGGDHSICAQYFFYINGRNGRAENKKESELTLHPDAIQATSTPPGAAVTIVERRREPPRPSSSSSSSSFLWHCYYITRCDPHRLTSWRIPHPKTAFPDDVINKKLPRHDR